ncbi:hypothetical protein GYH30_043344 [Glycine max]|nr:hypothetical protein GYH30_043344 [Glycine max]
MVTIHISFSSFPFLSLSSSLLFLPNTTPPSCWPSMSPSSPPSAASAHTPIASLTALTKLETRPASKKCAYLGRENQDGDDLSGAVRLLEEVEDGGFAQWDAMVDDGEVGLVVPDLDLVGVGGSEEEANGEREREAVERGLEVMPMYCTPTCSRSNCGFFGIIAKER